MEDSNKVKFKYKIVPMMKGQWSIGICLSHLDRETYLYINLFKWNLSIGFLEDY